MAYLNVPRIFNTAPPGKMSSRYYIYKDGLIRVKCASGNVLIEPGKNICYVADWAPNKHPIEKKVGWDYFKLLGEKLAYATVMDIMGDYQKALDGERTVDFELDGDGELENEDTFHRGHGISGVFNGKVEGAEIDVGQLDAWIEKTYGPCLGDIQAIARGKVALSSIKDEIT